MSASTNSESVAMESYRTGLLASILAGLGWLFDAYVITIFSLALPLIAVSFHVKATSLGFVASLFLVGYLVGTAGFGWLADHMGRKPTLSLSIGGYAVITALTGFAFNVWSLSVGRILTGIGGGGELPVGATFVSETWPAKHRGTGIGLMYFQYFLGYLLALGAAAALLPLLGWKAIFWASIIPGLLILLVRSRLEESPRYLKAKKSAELRHESHTRYGEVFSSRYVRYVISGGLIFISLAYCYYAITVFLPVFMIKDLHLTYGGMIGGQVWLTVSAAVFSVVAAWLSDVIGRKAMLIISALLAGIGQYLMFSQTSPIGFILVGLLPYAAIGMAWTLGIAYVNEIFPTRVRGTGFGVCVGIGRIVSIFAPIVSAALAVHLGLATAFKLSLPVWLLAIIGALMLPETKGRSLDAFEAPVSPSAPTAHSPQIASPT